MEFYKPNYIVHYNHGLRLRWVEVQRGKTLIKRYIKRSHPTGTNRAWYSWSSEDGQVISQFFPTLRDCIIDAASQ